MNWRANHHYVERADGSCVAQCPSHLNAQRLAGVPDLLASAEELLDMVQKDRDALFGACTVNGDPGTLEPGAAAIILDMDNLLESAAASIAVVRGIE